MLIYLNYTQIFKLNIGILLVVVVASVEDPRCLQYKKLIYEETKTISYFHPDARENLFTEDTCKSASAGFVVGGENALPKEFPFAALLGSYDGVGVNWFCGGTVISKNYILTAAHCFYSSRGTINRVRLGELDFNTSTDDADPEDFSVQKLIAYPEYHYNLPYNDIGLVLLASPINFSRYKHPACLPVPNTTGESQNSWIAIGWGHTKFSGLPSSHLQKVTLRRFGNCAWLAEGPEGYERLPFGLHDSQLCAGSNQPKDTCQGDSGGPLLVQHPQYPCMHIVVGVTSQGFSGCAAPNIPSLYTRVKSYISWIQDHLNQIS